MAGDRTLGVLIDPVASTVLRESIDVTPDEERAKDILDSMLAVGESCMSSVVLYSYISAIESSISFNIFENLDLSVAHGTFTS